MIRASDTILGKTRGTAEHWKSILRELPIRNSAEVMRYVDRIYQQAPRFGIDPAILIAQALVETGNFTSSWWINRLNPAGIGITGDPTQNNASWTWKNGAAAADSQIAHMMLYATGRNTTGFFDPREKDYVDAFGNTTKARTIDDLGGGVWAADPTYSETIVARGNQINPKLGETPVAPFSTHVPGLPGGPLQTTYPIRFNLIPLGNQFQRPGTKAHTPRVDVTHGTGNPSNPSAMAEAQYFVNGAEGRQASVHACIDDNEVVIVVPLDELTWQAADGGGPGNMNGNSSEMMEADVIWNNVARRNKLIAITADFKGRTAARLGITQPKKHYDYNAGSSDRHHCPDKLMTTGLWDSMYVGLWQAARADELKRMSGETPDDSEYAERITTGFNGTDTKITRKVTIKTGEKDTNGKAITEHVAVVYDVWLIERPFEVVLKTKRRQGPDSRGPIVGPPLEPGEEFTSAYQAVPRKQEGRDIPTTNYVVTDICTWIQANALHPRLSIRKA